MQLEEYLVHTESEDITVAYFDEQITFEPVAEQNTDPVLPEERFIFEMIGLEHTEPDEYRKYGGVKWSWRVFYENGAPFVLNDEQYIFWRITGKDSKGRPTLNEGTLGHTWATALLGRQLRIDDTLPVRELRGARFSAMVVWVNQKRDAKKKSATLASLRHISSGSAQNGTNGSVAPPADEKAALTAEVKRLIGEAMLESVEGADKTAADFKKNGAAWDVDKLRSAKEGLDIALEDAKKAVPF